MTHLTSVPGTVRPAVAASGRAALLTAAGFSVLAAATHLYVVPEHAEEWPAARRGLLSRLDRQPDPTAATR